MSWMTSWEVIGRFLEVEDCGALSSTALRCWRGFLALMEVPTQRVESRIPQLFATRHPFRCSPERSGCERACDGTTFLGAGDKVGSLERAHVLHEPCERHTVRRGEVAHAASTATEHIERLPPCRVRQRREHGIEIDVTMLNHEVKLLAF